MLPGVDPCFITPECAHRCLQRFGKSHGNYLLPRFCFFDVPKTLQTTVRALSLVKTGLAPRSMFFKACDSARYLSHETRFFRIDFHANLPCVFFVVFYGILNPPGLRDKGSGGRAKLDNTTRTLGRSLYREKQNMRDPRTR